MARTTNRGAAARRSRAEAREVRGAYVDGNTVRKLSAYPQRNYAVPAEKPDRAYPKRPKRTRPKKNLRPAVVRSHTLSREAKQNREKAMSMNRGFVIFIGVMSVAVLFFCIHYLRLKSEYTSMMSEVATLESELSDLREENDAYYSEVTASVDLEKIRKIAIGRLGMQTPAEDQIQTYSTEGGSYVRQYQDVPES